MKLFEYLNTSGLNYACIQLKSEMIVLIEDLDSKDLRLFKSRLENRPSTLGLKLIDWTKNSYSMKSISDDTPIQIVTCSSDNPVSTYILKNAIDQNNIKFASRVGFILFLAQTEGSEDNIVTALMMNKDMEFNFAFYLSVQEVAVKIANNHPEFYSQLPTNITRAFLKHSSR